MADRLARRSAAAVLLVLLLALALRLLVVAHTSDYAPVADPAEYDRYGVAVAAGQWPSSTLSQTGGTAYRPPAYPLMLGAVYKLTGGGVPEARLVQALLGTLSVALVGVLGMQLLGRGVGLAAMALAAVYPPFLVVGSALVAEALALPVVLSATAAALQARTSPRPRRWLLLAGALAGIAVLTRVNALLVLPLVALLSRPPGSGMRELRRSAVVLIAGVLVMSPWTVRNALVLDAFVPLSTQAGATLAGTYNDAARSGTLPPADEFSAQWVEWYRVPHLLALADPHVGEPEVERRLRSAAVSYALDHPGYTASVVGHNLARLVHVEAPYAFARYDARAIGLPPRAGELGAIGWWVLVLLAGVGLTRRVVSGVPLSFWLVGLCVLPSLAFSSYLRFRIGIDAIALLPAGATVSAAVSAVRGRRSAPG